MLQFLTQNARWLAAGFLLTFFSGFGQTYFVSLSNNTLIERFDLSHGQLGLIYGLATLLSALVIIEFGKIIDRYSARNSAIIVIIGLALSCVIMAFVSNLAMVFIALFGVRLFGQGMMSHVAMTSIARWYDAQRGRAVSIAALGFPASQGIMPSLALIALPILGYHNLWLASAFIAVILVMPLSTWLLSKERSPASTSEEVNSDIQSRKHWRRGDVFSEWSFYLLFLGTLCAPFMGTALFYHQQHLVEIKNWTPATFALAFPLFAVTQIFSSLIAGWLVDKITAIKLLPLYGVPMAFGFILLGLNDTLLMLYPAMILIAFSMGASIAIGGSLWPELYGTKYLGEIRALMSAFGVGSTAAAPFLTGWLIDQQVAFDLQLAGMGIYTFFACALMYALQPRLRSVASKAE